LPSFSIVPTSVVAAAVDASAGALEDELEEPPQAASESVIAAAMPRLRNLFTFFIVPPFFTFTFYFFISGRFFSANILFLVCRIFIQMPLHLPVPAFICRFMLSSCLYLAVRLCCLPVVSCCPLMLSSGCILLSFMFMSGYAHLHLYTRSAVLRYSE